MKKGKVTITEREYILISKGLSHLIDEYTNYENSEKYIKEIKEIKSKLVKPFNNN